MIYPVPLLLLVLAVACFVTIEYIRGRPSVSHERRVVMRWIQLIVCFAFILAAAWIMEAIAFVVGVSIAVGAASLVLSWLGIRGYK